jgi:hypothetical protein
MCARSVEVVAHGGWLIFVLHHSHGGCPILAFLQGWAAVLPAQLSVLRYPLCMPPSYPHLWQLLQFEAVATRLKPRSAWQLLFGFWE